MPWFWQSEPERSPKQRPWPGPNPIPSYSVQDPNDPTPLTNDDLGFLAAFTDPKTLTATFILTSAVLGASRLYKNRLRRIPTAAHLKPAYFHSSSNTKGPVELKRSQSLLGYVTSTHDPDNFRFFHAPGGRLLLWGTPFRKVPTARAELKDNTLSVRIAGIDAPELAHFGNPAQPYAEEALSHLKSIIEGQRIRIWPLRRDQYERTVCLAFIRRKSLIWGDGWFHGLKEEGWRGFWRKDVGLQMLRLGAATVYEGKFGAEYGGAAREKEYRLAEDEAKRKGIGMWKGASRGTVSLPVHVPGIFNRLISWLRGKPPTSKKAAPKFETPREYKQRMAERHDYANKSKHKS